MDVSLALLKATPTPPSLRPLHPKVPALIATDSPSTVLPLLLSAVPEGSLLALDFETKGDYADLDSYAVGVGLANEQGSVYISLTNSAPNTLPVLAQILRQKSIRLLAHNLFFDAGWLMRDLDQAGAPRQGLSSKEPGFWPNWHACTYALYRLLASEGYPGQQYGLKKAQVELLKWPSSNEHKLDLWLIENEYVANISKTAKEGYYYFPAYAKGARRSAEAVPETLGEDDRFVSPKKEMMYLAPDEILGEYCRLDAQSTFDLYTRVLEPVMAKFEGLQWYMHELYMRFLYLLIWQKISGITVDFKMLDMHRANLESRIGSLKQEFLEHPEVKPHVDAYSRRIIEEHLAKEPKQHKGEWPPLAPANQYKKDGTETQAWLSYQAKLAAGPITSQVWLHWRKKLDELSEASLFNLNSGPQKQWLFYEAMGYPIRSTTESGQPATDEVALRQFGAPGKLLSDYISAEKELGFNQSLRNVINPITSKYHPSFKVPGTHTGRLAGAGGFNAQNPPKSLDYLAVFTVPEPYVIVTCDHASLEDYVLAELSRDASLWNFYGPGSRKGDCMYLSVGSRLPVLGQKIREAGYDPENWTPESVKAAKKTASKWRQVAKKVVLSANYQAGPGKIHASLLEDGIDISLEEVVKMHRGFWDLRRGVKVWESELRRQWKDNGGWLLNGFGRPICLEPMREKDLVNSQCQSVGHDAHVLFQVLTAEELSGNGFDWYPWHMDLHDCLMFAVHKDQAEAAAKLLKDVVYPKLNKMLGGEIHLKGEPNICLSWADDKDETYDWKTNEKTQNYLATTTGKKDQCV